MSNKTTSVAKVLTFLAALYPRFELTKTTVAAYTEILGDIPPELLQAAAKDLGSRSTFFPAAAELRAAAFDLAQQAQDIPSAYDAWEQVRGQFHGRPGPLHPLAKKAINSLGGVNAFGSSSIDAETSWRARFIQAYETLVARERRELDMLPQIAAYVDRLERLPAGQEPDRGRMLENIAETARKLKGVNGDE